MATESFVKSVLESTKGNQSVKEFEKSSQSYFDKFQALLKESTALQLKLREVNQTTEIKVAGKTMTISEALILKNLVNHRKHLLNQITRQNSKAESEIETNEGKIETKANATFEKLSKENASKEQMEAQLQVTRSSAILEFRLAKIAGFDVKSFIDKETEFLTNFNEEIDYVLSEINATTTIEVEV